jgi:hypothetical protein
MLFDDAVLDQMYDESQASGTPPLGFSLVDARVLFPRSMVLGVITGETGEELSADELDQFERDRLFKWLSGAGDGGCELGVPLYIPSRIGLCAKLLRNGWPLDEVRDFVEWEEWLVEDALSVDLSYEDDDRKLVAREIRFQLERINDEIWSRVPADQPSGWEQRSWHSELQRQSLPELEAERDRLERYVGKLAATDLTSSDRWRHHVGRQAYRMRARDEFVRVATILGDRKKVEAGFSFGVQFKGEHSVFPDREKPESFGMVDWARTLLYPRFLDDPDRFAFRLPGLAVVGGKVLLDDLLPSDVYQSRVDLFRLTEYVTHFKEIAASPRCANCARVLPRRASQRRLYCSDQCSQAARQRTYRERQKAAVLGRSSAVSFG